MIGSAGVGTSCSSSIGPTSCSSRSSSVTRPATPPYSSSTMAIWVRLPAEVFEQLEGVLGLGNAEGRPDQLARGSRNRDRSASSILSEEVLAERMPTMSSRFSPKSGIRLRPVLRKVSAAAWAVTVAGRRDDGRAGVMISETSCGSARRRAGAGRGSIGELGLDVLGPRRRLGGDLDLDARRPGTGSRFRPSECSSEVLRPRAALTASGQAAPGTGTPRARTRRGSARRKPGR